MQLKTNHPDNKPDSIWRFICVMLCAAMLCCAFFYAGNVYAEEAPTTQPDPDTHYTGDLFCPYNYDGLSGRVVHCIESIVVQAAKSFLEGFLPFYEAMILSCMVLAITIYGVMIAIGSVSRPAQDSFFLLFKLAAVAFFSLQFGKMIELIFDVMHGLLDIVTNYVTVSSVSACSDSSHVGQFFDLGRDNPTIWDKVDCLFITLLGISVIKTASAGAGVALSFGLIAVLAAAAFTGGIGLTILFIAIFYVLTLLFSVLRAIKIYLVSVISIAFLMCVSPLIIPMALFGQTKALFNNWLKNLINYIVIPVFLFAFLSMIVAAFDAILFKGPSSLYYAIAGQASQETGFNFKDWMEYGTSGKVVRDANGIPQFNGDVPVTVGGDFVGKDVPGLDAIAIMTMIDSCNKATGVELTLLGEQCEDMDNLNAVLDCAINPIVAVGDAPSGQGGSCKDRTGRPYYGFLRNEEIFNFVIAPNITTDAAARDEKEEEDCGWNLFCHAGEAASKVSGFVFNLQKQIVGGIAQFYGNVWKFVGEKMKAVGSFMQDYCPPTSIGLVPGALCDLQGNMLVAAGSMVHTAGSVTNFTGRVLVNGLMAELGELFDVWFNVNTIDFQKIASYRCKMKTGLTDPKDFAYLECPGPEAVIMDILYVLLAACVVAYLMHRWLNYIPTLGSKMMGITRLDTSVPGESAASNITATFKHRLEEMKKRKGGGG